MRYGIFSDIHSNLEALEVVLSFFEREKVESTLCCGDIVGYGPNPNEVIERLLNLNNFKAVAGNHDRAAVNLMNLGWFNPRAAEAIEWTASVLSPKSRDFLTQLPEKCKFDGFALVHGSPRNPLEEYIFQPQQYEENLDFFSTPICFNGHTHLPALFFHETGGSPGMHRLSDGEAVHLNPKDKVMLNVGSVGQPRDGDVRASCAVFDSAAGTVVLHRLGYPVGKVQEKMRAARLPPFLIDRLSRGA